MKINLHNIKDAYKSKQCNAETMELRGYEHIKTLFVDSSGFGQEDEPALTTNQFEKELAEIIKEHGEVYCTVLDSGMFQVYIGVFKKLRKSNMIRKSGNVYERIEGDDLIVRLYDTDIVRNNEKTTTLNSGGYRTRTTSKWINSYLPSQWSLYQKAFEWYLTNSQTGQTIKFEDGIVIDR